MVLTEESLSSPLQFQLPPSFTRTHDFVGRPPNPIALETGLGLKLYWTKVSGKAEGGRVSHSTKGGDSLHVRPVKLSRPRFAAV